MSTPIAHYLEEEPKSPWIALYTEVLPVYIENALVKDFITARSLIKIHGVTAQLIAAIAASSKLGAKVNTLGYTITKDADKGEPRVTVYGVGTYHVIPV